MEREYIYIYTHGLHWGYAGFILGFYWGIIGVIYVYIYICV